MPRIAPGVPHRKIYLTRSAGPAREVGRQEGLALTTKPDTVALVCPACGHAEVFLWELLEKGQQV
jgi:hypothetical protein